MLRLRSPMDLQITPPYALLVLGQEQPFRCAALQGCDRAPRSRRLQRCKSAERMLPDSPGEHLVSYVIDSLRCKQGLGSKLSFPAEKQRSHSNNSPWLAGSAALLLVAPRRGSWLQLRSWPAVRHAIVPDGVGRSHRCSCLAAGLIPRTQTRRDAFGHGRPSGKQAANSCHEQTLLVPVSADISGLCFLLAPQVSSRRAQGSL